MGPLPEALGISNKMPFLSESSSSIKRCAISNLHQSDEGGNGLQLDEPR